MSRAANRWGAAAPIHLTIFADASVCDKTGAAGWGAWFKGAGLERGQTCGGPFEMKLHMSDDAELLALAHALAECDSRGLLTAGATVMLQSDCTAALGVIAALTSARDCRVATGSAVSRRRKPPTRKMRKGVDQISAIVTAHGLRILVRHVRGHQQGEGRNWVNRECDRIAREGMLARRAELQPKEPA